jgi:hypothetical protein
MEQDCFRFEIWTGKLESELDKETGRIFILGIPRLGGLRASVVDLAGGGHGARSKLVTAL